MKYLFQENGKASGTKTAFTIGCATVFSKIILSGVTFGDLRLGADNFDMAGAGVLLAALGAMLYAKKTDDTKRAAQT